MDEVALLEGLLERYSPTYQEKEAAAFLTGQLSEAGFSTFIDEAGSAVAMKGSGAREILLLGHIDTVPGQIPVRREGDLLYGRGAVDAKGPLACFAAAAARVTPPPGWRVTVIGAVGEEEDSRGARHLRSRHHPAMLVIGEPSKWDHITLGFRGSVWFNYQVARPVGHTAGPDESACEAAVAFWQRVRAWTGAANAGIPQVYNQVSATIRGMQSSSDGFEDKALLRIGVRLPPALTLDQVTATLEEMKGDGGLAVLPGGVEAYRAEKNTPLVRGFLSAIRAAGGTPVFSMKTGTSDMNMVAPVWNCPAVAYGPGDSRLDHTPNEHLSLSEYGVSIDVLAGVLAAVMR